MRRVDRAAAALALAADDLLVRQPDLARAAPVDRDLRLVREALFQELEEDPLRPLVVRRIGRIHLARPVEGEADALELAAEIGHVLDGHVARVLAGLDRVVLRRQAERVPADRVEDVVSFHAPLAGDHVERGVAARVADVEPFAGGIGELDEDVVLRLARLKTRIARPGGAEGLLLFPIPLPFLLDLGEIVSRGWHVIFSRNS